LEPRDEFERKVYRKSKSSATLRFYRSGRTKFEQFCRYEHEAGINEIAKQVKTGRIDPYKLLDSYVSWLGDQGLRPKTVRDYAQGAKKLLRHYDVVILNELFQDKVTLPTVEEILDEAPTPDEIRLILARCNVRMRAFILLLATSGMRLGEAVQLTLGDVDLDSTPARIVIPAQYTKNSRERETYISEETRMAVQTWLETWRSRKDWKLPSPENRLFRFEGEVHMAEKNASHVFRRIMGHFPELDKPVSGGHRVHRIHFHSFRKFFYSRTMPVIGEERAHALMGHSFYMQTYYRRSKEDRMDDYSKCAGALSIVKPASSVTREEMERKVELQFYWLSVENSPLGRSPKEALEEAERRAGRSLTTEDQISILKEEYTSVKEQEVALMEEGTERLIAHRNESPSQKVIDEADLEGHLRIGWQFVNQLKSGRIVVKKQSEESPGP
jgi:integrase